VAALGELGGGAVASSELDGGIGRGGGLRRARQRGDLGPVRQPRRRGGGLGRDQRRGELSSGATSGELGDGGSGLHHEQCLGELSSYPISRSLSAHRRMGIGMCLFVKERFW
jgi:hypothetical protein